MRNTAAHVVAAPVAGKPSAADFAEYRRTRDPRQRDRLVEAHLHLAYSAAQRFAGRGEEIADLRQVALLALVHAVERFDPARGFAFSSFAVPTIAGTLKRHFRDRTWAVRPPRSVQDRYLQVSAAVEELTRALSRTPTVSEIATYGGWTDQQVSDALAARLHRQLEHWSGPGDDGPSDPGTVDDHLGRVEDRDIVEHLLGKLGAREQEIVRLRYFEEMTQSAIGERIGVSQMHVSRMLAVSLNKLRIAAADRQPSPH